MIRLLRMIIGLMRTRYYCAYDNGGVDDDLGVGVVAGGSMQVNPSLSNMRPI